MGDRMQGRSLIVTGGSKGIGRGIAQAFAREGAKVLLAARQADAGEQAAQAITDAGGVASFFQADVSNSDDVEAMAKAAVDRHGGIDILCSNAGIFPSANIEEMSEDEWDTVNSVNLKGTFMAVKACLPELKKVRSGSHNPHLVHHRPDHRLPRLVALWRYKGRATRLHAHCRHRVGAPQHHDQRNNARQHHDRGPRRCRGGLPPHHGKIDPNGQAGGPRRYRIRDAVLRVARS